MSEPGRLATVGTRPTFLPVHPGWARVRYEVSATRCLTPRGGYEVSDTSQGRGNTSGGPAMETARRLRLCPSSVRVNGMRLASSRWQACRLRRCAVLSAHRDGCTVRCPRWAVFGHGTLSMQLPGGPKVFDTAAGTPPPETTPRDHSDGDAHPRPSAASDPLRFRDASPRGGLANPPDERTRCSLRGVGPDTLKFGSAPARRMY